MSDDKDILEWLQDAAVGDGADLVDGKTFLAVPPEWFDKAINEITRLRTELENLRTLARIANVGPSFSDIKQAAKDAPSWNARMNAMKTDG